MSNPVFSNSPIFGEKANRDVQRFNNDLNAPGTTQFGGQPGAQPGAQFGTQYASQSGTQFGTQGQAAMDAASTQQHAYTPAAAGANERAMTYEDVLMKTTGLFAVLLITAVVGWQLVSDYPAVLWIGLVGGLILGLVNAFKKSPSAPLILAYAALEGLFLGAISAVYNYQWDGIVLQAVLATFAVFAVALVAFRSGKIRVTPKFNRWLILAMGGYLVFSLLNWILVATGVLDGWGMRGGAMGIGIGLFAVGLAAFSLISDFDFIERGVKSGIPAKFAWTAAFGLMVTLVWLYLELLRLLAILRGDN